MENDIFNLLTDQLIIFSSFSNLFCLFVSSSDKQGSKPGREKLVYTTEKIISICNEGINRESKPGQMGVHGMSNHWVMPTLSNQTDLSNWHDK